MDTTQAYSKLNVGGGLKYKPVVISAIQPSTTYTMNVAETSFLIFKSASNITNLTLPTAGGLDLTGLYYSIANYSNNTITTNVPFRIGNTSTSTSLPIDSRNILMYDGTEWVLIDK